MSSSRMKKQLSIKEKLEILRKLENNDKISDVAKIYNMTTRTIYRIKMEKENLELFANDRVDIESDIKRMKKSRVPTVEKLLYAWFVNQREKKNQVTNCELQAKAMEIHRTCDSNVKFESSLGWLQKFKKRHGIRSLTISGEKLSANISAVPKFLKKFQDVLNNSNLLPDQVYNADETGLVYKGLNKKTLVCSTEKTAPGGKTCKERITIMPCMNASGNHQLPLMIIGKSKNPRCFRNEILPKVHYRSSKNAWQTRLLFKEWFEKVFKPEVTEFLEKKNLPVKAILLLDNASCHEDLSTEDFQIIFFPPNTTALIQPLDQSVIGSLKVSYRKKLILHLLIQPDIDLIEKIKKLNLKTVLFLIDDAWRNMNKSVLINGWKAVYDGSTANLELNLTANHFNDDIPLSRLFRYIHPETSLSDQEILEWGTGSNDVERHEIEDEDLLNDTVNTDEINDNHSEETFENGNIDEVIQSLNRATDWALSRPNKIPLCDILTLRKLTEIAAIEKYAN